MKKYDIFGEEVNVGDNIVIIEPHYRNFINAKVIKLTPMAFRVKYYPYDGRERETITFGVIKGKMGSDTK